MKTLAAGSSGVVERNVIIFVRVDQRILLVASKDQTTKRTWWSTLCA